MVFGTDFKQGFLVGAAVIIVFTFGLGLVVYGNLLSDDAKTDLERDAEDVLGMKYIPYQGDVVIVVDGGMNHGEEGVVVSRESNNNAYLYYVIEARELENGEVRECGYNDVGPVKDLGCWTQGYRWNEIEMVMRPEWAIQF